MPNIDMHHHIMIPEAEAIAAKERERRPHHANLFENFFPPISLEYNLKMSKENWGEQMRSVDRKRQDMKADRLEMALASPAPPFFYYWITGPKGKEVTQVLNDGVAAFCKENSKDFRGLASLPFQNGGRAAALELERAMGMGLLGTIVGEAIQGQALDEPQFEKFWEAAERLGALVFIHPDFADFKPLFPYYLANCVGNPLSTTVTIIRLILSGLFDRHPGLKVLLAHCGGNLPWALGRITHAWEVRPETKMHTSHPPRHYLKNLYIDVITFNPAGLKWAVEQVGADHVVCGTDYPFDMMQERVVDFVESAGLTQEEEDKILRTTPAKLLGL